MDYKEFSRQSEYKRIYFLKELAKKPVFAEKDLELAEKILFNDPDPIVRHEVGFWLGEVGTPKAVEMLAKAMLNDKSVVVRHECAEALGWITTEESRKALEKALHDKDEIVRLTAKISLDIHKNPRE